MGRRRSQATAGLGALRARLGTGAAADSRGRCARGAAPPGTAATLRNGTTKLASELTAGDVVVVAAGEVIPADGIVVEGIAWVEESAITGESAPVIRESGTDRNAVSGGSRIISEWLVVEIT